MLRVGKLTDYAIVVMTHLARVSGLLHSANEIAADIGLALPTVSKVMKALVQNGLLVSHRGSKGGYSLAFRPQEISVAQVIAAIEGPIALTECSDARGLCGQESLCAVRPNWQRINLAVREALEKVTLAELASQVTTYPVTFTPPAVLRELGGA